MLDRLPVYIEPVSFAEKGKHFTGSVHLNQLTRLSKDVLDQSGTVEVNVAFKKGENHPVLEGNVITTLVLECQGCLGEIELSIDRNFTLGFVSSIEQADDLPSGCEPFIMGDEKIAVNDLIEDELLLAIPDFPRHSHNCVVISERNNQEQQGSQSNNPFSVLAKLKNTGD